MTRIKRWAVRAWRWKVEIQPLQTLLFYGALYALTVFLPDGELARCGRFCSWRS